MIVFLRGNVFAIHENSVDLDVNGVGYRVFVAERVLHALSLHKSAFLYTYQHLREDTQELYGFLQDEERGLFLKLLAISGVGPKSALAMVGSTDAETFIRWIESEDVDTLCRLPGIGKKTASRLILELKGKLVVPISPSANVSTPTTISLPAMDKEVVEALISLGYSERESLDALASARAELPDASVETLLKAALQKSFRA
ncbi:Holliday junction branch migration protein RuvA [Alicyclobacillus tolerans]|uniref:Holliday junction branch migration protein RuvA n=1 Tax=Alicyclobacillus tolerans TaxID=90970 RepID=UPI003B7E3C4D